MSLPHVIFALVSSNVPLANALGNRVYEANAFGVRDDKTIPAKPFMVIRYGGESPGPKGNHQWIDTIADFYVYGEPGDYTAINRILSQLTAALHDPAGASYTDPLTDEKTFLVDSRYMGKSPELFDDIYRANMRYGTYRFVGNTE